MTRLNGKVALVTGAAAGIGQAIAWRFAAEGAQVLATDRSDDMAATLAGGDGRIASRVCDVTDPAALIAAVADCVGRFGRLDILVNNAGYAAPMVPVDQFDLGEWRKTFAINLDGVLHAIQAAVPQMKAQGSGSIINIASMGSVKALPDLAGYCSSKAAVMQLTKVAALDLGQYNIRVNAIGPGYTRTGFGGGYSDEVADYLASQNPMKRIGTPADVAGTALYLASDDSAWVNGSMHFVCGGASAL